MVLSRGLLISLGFTLLVGILLFIFVKQRTSSIENKINTLFQLVQEEAAKSHQAMLASRESNMVIEETTRAGESNQLIAVSDGESSEESDDDLDTSDDSDIESSEESDEEEEHTPQAISSVVALEMMNHVENVTEATEELEQEQEQDNVRTIHLTENANTLQNGHEENNSSDNEEDLGIEEIDLESEVEDDREHNDSEQVNHVDIQVKKVVSDDISDIVNYKKLSVSRLRDIVKEKGLHEDPKSLKKAQLIELLEH